MDREMVVMEIVEALGLPSPRKRCSVSYRPATEVFGEVILSSTEKLYQGAEIIFDHSRMLSRYWRSDDCYTKSGK